MAEAFENKIRAAAIAGWWTFLIGTAFLVLQWFAFLLIMSTQPAWLLFLWGRGFTWEDIRSVWFWGIAIAKLCLWLLALASMWLTMWSRQLRKRCAE